MEAPSKFSSPTIGGRIFTCSGVDPTLTDVCLCLIHQLNTVNNVYGQSHHLYIALTVHIKRVHQSIDLEPITRGTRPMKSKLDHGPSLDG